MPTITYTQALTTVTCTCGMNYAIPAALDAQLLERKASASVFCPLGHQWHYSGKTDAEKAREALAAEQRRAATLLSQLDQERASHRSTKGQLTKTKNRVKAGVCPVPGCKRQIVQMQRHIASKHPGWHPEHRDENPESTSGSPSTNG